MASLRTDQNSPEYTSENSSKILNHAENKSPENLKPQLLTDKNNNLPHTPHVFP